MDRRGILFVWTSPWGANPQESPVLGAKLCQHVSSLDGLLRLWTWARGEGFRVGGRVYEDSGYCKKEESVEWVEETHYNGICMTPYYEEGGHDSRL